MPNLSHGTAGNPERVLGAGAADDSDRTSAAKASRGSGSRSKADAGGSSAGSKGRSSGQAQKSVAADAMEKLADTTEAATRQLDESAPGIAEMARTAGRAAEGAIENLRAGGLDDMLEALARATRQQPLGMVAGAFFAGLILSRLFGSRAQS